MMKFACCGLVVFAATGQPPANEVLQAVRRIEHMGGVISYADCEKKIIEVNLGLTNVNDTMLTDLNSFKDLVALYLDRTSITSKGALKLNAFKNLERLNLAETLIDDEALKWVSLNGKPKNLDLSNRRISDKGLSVISTLTLESLVLWDTKITDAGLKHLAEMKSLQRLHLRRTEVTPQGIASLQKLLPSLSISR